MAVASRMTTVRLYGPLRKFGKEFELNVKSPREAFRALCSQLPALEKYIVDAESKGIEFAVFNGKRNIGEDELDLGAKPVVKLAPVYGGRKKNGLFQTILGVVLIAVAWWNPAGWAGAGMLMSSGVGLALGGIVQMLTKPPAGLADSSDAENKSSYAFGQPVNTTAQGTPVAVWYGYREVGGAVISASIVSEDQM